MALSSPFLEKFLNSGDGWKNQAKRIAYSMANAGIDMADMFTGTKDVLRDMFDVASDADIDLAQTKLNYLQQELSDAINAANQIQDEELTEGVILETAANPIGTAANDRQKQRSDINEHNKRTDKRNSDRRKAAQRSIDTAQSNYDTASAEYDRMSKKRDDFDNNTIKYVHDHVHEVV